MAKTEKKERILEAAFQLFLTKGLSETKMIDIANSAGVGKGTIYEYFSSKDELFEILFERKVFRFYRGLDEELRQQPTAKAKLETYLAFDTDLPTKMEISREAVYNLLLDSGPGHRCNTPAKKCIKQLMDHRFALLYNIISEGVEKGEFMHIDPLLAATAIMGSMAFYVSFNLDLFDEGPLDEYMYEHKKEGAWEIKDFLNLVLNGLCIKQQESCA